MQPITKHLTELGKTGKRSLEGWLPQTTENNAAVIEKCSRLYAWCAAQWGSAKFEREVGRLEDIQPFWAELTNYSDDAVRAAVLQLRQESPHWPPSLAVMISKASDFQEEIRHRELALQLWDNTMAYASGELFDGYGFHIGYRLINQKYLGDTWHACGMWSEYQFSQRMQVSMHGYVINVNDYVADAYEKYNAQVNEYAAQSIAKAKTLKAWLHYIDYLRHPDINKFFDAAVNDNPTIAEGLVNTVVYKYFWPHFRFFVKEKQLKAVQ